MTSSCAMCQSEPLKCCSLSWLSSPKSLKYIVFCLLEFVVDLWNYKSSFWSSSVTFCTNDPFLITCDYSKPVWTVIHSPFFAFQDFSQKMSTRRVFIQYVTCCSLSVDARLMYYHNGIRPCTWYKKPPNTCLQRDNLLKSLLTMDII